MAFKEIAREWSPCQLDYVKTFLLHSEKDLKDLPKCCIGSKAIVSETDNEYFCTESGWKLGSELGGGSSPSEVVILPETVTTVEEGQAYIATPLSATPTAGVTAKVTYNGTEYTCMIVYAGEDGIDTYAMGNFDAIDMPFTGGNPDAPFVVALIPAGEGGMYGMVMALDDATSVTISIVQVGAASGGENAGGGVLTVNCKISTSFVDNTTVFSDADKTWAEVVAAHNAGMPVRIVATYTEGTAHMDFVGDCRAAIIGTNNDYLVVSFPSNMLCSAFKPFTLSSDGGALKFELFTG